MVTRRAARRAKLLRPDPELNNLYAYCLAVLSEPLGILVHGVTVMANHHHIVLTDTRGNLPHFLQELHRTLALGIKVLRKWEGAVWDSEKPSVVELRTDQALVEKIAYCMANPVAARTVPHAHQWPGLNVVPQQLGLLSWTALRPVIYFDETNPRWPAVATLRLVMPPSTMSDEVVRAAVASELLQLEAEVHREMKASGMRFLGPEKVLTQSPYTRAVSWEPLRERSPTFAVGRDRRDAFVEAVIVLREFRKAYREALHAWRNGLRQVLFPVGTWLMRHVHAVEVAPS